jgi:hypothetical protein
MELTCRVGADDSETSELLGDGEDHDGESAFLPIIQPRFPFLNSMEALTKLRPLKM